MSDDEPDFLLTCYTCAQQGRKVVLRLDTTEYLDHMESYPDWHPGRAPYSERVSAPSDAAEADHG